MSRLGDGEAGLQLGEFAVATVIAGVGDEGGFGAGEGGGNVEGEAGALQREVCEVEPHLVACDVLHLGKVGVDALDQVRVASRSAAPPVSCAR